jgi:Fur family transcriptional regulator, ferric uptake regulator
MDKCSAETLLAEKKIKATKQRITVLEQILSMDSSFCAGDLSDVLKNEMDTVTIYRNLLLLCREGILREVMNKNDRQYFEISCIHNPNHPHFFCNSCNKIYCLKKVKDFDIPGKITPGKDFIIHETVLHYNGICPLCRS